MPSGILPIYLPGKRLTPVAGVQQLFASFLKRDSVR